ncbi:hypothetical protein NXW38_09730 [Bacteroides ovatus]|nr:hypothetical protein [Bacteroides ovatus]
MKRFGPVPVITSTLSVNADYSETPRPSMDDCISFISSECDKVAEVLDLTPGRGIDSDLGRATKGAALALKSRVLLYAVPVPCIWTGRIFRKAIFLPIWRNGKLRHRLRKT